MNGTNRAVVIYSDSFHVGLPFSIGTSGNVTARYADFMACQNTFFANFAFCHMRHLLYLFVYAYDNMMALKLQEDSWKGVQQIFVVPKFSIQYLYCIAHHPTRVQQIFVVPFIVISLSDEYVTICNTTIWNFCFHALVARTTINKKNL
jgi:hypothetical protein